VPTFCWFQGPWSEVPAVGLYCMDLELRSNDECLISKRISLYPWIRWNADVSDCVMNISSETELCHSSVVENLAQDIPCLAVSDLGIMCDIPAVCKHVTDISLEQNIPTVDDNILNKHATGSHLEAADALLSVLSDSVCLRVMYQDARCHVCLLQQHCSESEADMHDLQVLHSNVTSTNSLAELISGNSVVDFARESPVGYSSGLTDDTSLHDVGNGTQYRNQTAAGGALPSFCHASTRQFQHCSSADASNGQVCIM